MSVPIKNDPDFPFDSNGNYISGNDVITTTAPPAPSLIETKKEPKNDGKDEADPAIQKTAISTTPVTSTQPKKRPVAAISRSSSTLSASSKSIASRGAAERKIIMSKAPGGGAAGGIVNPYTTVTKMQNGTLTKVRKFVGGAETTRVLAQRKARRPPARRILKPGESLQTQEDEVLPKRMNSIERFFASILRSSPTEIFVSESSSDDKLWEAACRRTGLSMPTAPIEPKYGTKKAHFEVRAALMLEEARASIAQPLEKLWRNANNDDRKGNRKTQQRGMILTAQNFDRESSNYGHPKITFVNKRRQLFSPDELFHIRPGSVFQCIPREGGYEISLKNVYLGVIVFGARDQVETSKSFTCMFFREMDLPVKIDNTEWLLTPVCTLISELRAFEAMTNNPGDVAFWSQLIGMPKATHTRFPHEKKEEVKDDKQIEENEIENENEDFFNVDVDNVNDDDDDNDDLEEASIERPPSPNTARAMELMQAAIAAASEGALVPGSDVVQTDSTPVSIAEEEKSQATADTEEFLERPKLDNDYFYLPTLNKTQEKAASSYLESALGSITLVQGPPGTGKTTLLVSVICRYLLENASFADVDDDFQNRRRLMVCAPTNKAISVLASRVMDRFKEGSLSRFNAVMVGDAEKLLGDERSRNNSFDNNCDENFGRLRPIFLYTWIQTVIDEYQQIRNFFMPGYRGRNNVNNIHALSVKLQQRLLNSLPYLSKEIIALAAEITSSLEKQKEGSAVVDTVPKIERQIDALRDLDKDAVTTQLLSSADLIFCTLSSSGASILKKTDPIHDLIVDEAAASSEPELCIPFHLKPTRMLAVGDPLQLPATVFSRRAMELGLTKSLHERLMYDCDAEHIMLDVQYRMNPEISAFPSKQFYDSKISDGQNVLGPRYMHGPRLLDRLPYTFLQVTGVEEQSATGSYQNRAEALKIADLLCDLRRMAAPHESFSWHSAERVRVITFYQSQVSLIKKVLYDRGFGNRIVVATVDSSQGCEADIVLISFVRSPKPNAARYNPGFLRDDRRMNVALTRAKFQLICVGNVRCFPEMKDATTMHALSTDAIERDVIRPFPDSRGHPYANMNARLDLFYAGSGNMNHNNRKRNHKPNRKKQKHNDARNNGHANNHICNNDSGKQQGQGPPRKKFRQN